MKSITPVLPASEARTVRRRVTLALLTIVAALALMEACCAVAFRIASGSWHVLGLAGGARLPADPTEASGRMTAASRRASRAVRRHRVQHPYLGYVYDPADPDPRVAVDPWGFASPAPLVQPRREGRVVVAIMGGSMAADVAEDGREALVRELRQSRAFDGREIVVVSAAVGAWKQPQQLLALSYFLSLGGHFDVVVNLDGFNEIYVPSVNNARRGLALDYPMDWDERIDGTQNPRLLLALGRRHWLTDERTEISAGLRSSGLRFLSTPSLLWLVLDRWFARELRHTQEAVMRASSEAGGGLGTHGPEMADATPEGVMRRAVEIRRDSSEQMHRLATANGALYVNFLQPNQYVPGNKPMGDAERAVALADDWVGSAVRNGYPGLVAAGRTLRERGVRFHDLSMLFQQEDRALYVDSCCHVSEAGSALLGRAIGATVRGDLGSVAP